MWLGFKRIDVTVPRYLVQAAPIPAQLTMRFSSFFIHISLGFVFGPAARSTSFIPFRDNIVTGPMYSFTCQCCETLYVGQTYSRITLPRYV